MMQIKKVWFGPAIYYLILITIDKAKIDTVESIFAKIGMIKEIPKVHIL